jgi:hypothetical protein
VVSDENNVNKLFTIHLVITNVESVHQHVAYINELDESWVLI